MNPSYKFELTATNTGGTETRTGLTPIWGDDVALDTERESNEYYWRTKLDGKIIFNGPDYAWIMNKANAYFDTEFELVVYITYDGTTWTEYWRGTFYMADCDVDLDNNTVEVEPDVKDNYSAILAGIDNKYNLIKLAPELQALNISKRCALQVYITGAEAIGVFLGGMYWEEECTAIDDTTELTDTYYFGAMKEAGVAVVRGASIAAVNTMFQGTPPINWTGVTGSYRFEFAISVAPYGNATAKIYDNDTDVQLWEGTRSNSDPYGDFTMNPVSGQEALGTCTAYVTAFLVWGRLIMNSDTYGGNTTYDIPDDDLVTDNRNYQKCYPYTTGTGVLFSGTLSEDATEWGLFDDGQYYAPPVGHTVNEYYPVSRTTWGRVSVWLRASSVGDLSGGDVAYTLKDAYPIESVIQVLLNEIAPGVKFEGTADYSDFLFNSSNAIFQNDFKLFLTPKSNILAGEYDAPAQKAETSLKTILEMLRDCFRCYWFVESVTVAGVTEVRFRIEHVLYFLKGGTYGTTPAAARDLTSEFKPRVPVLLTAGTNKYSFEKVEMPERYEFEWMDDVTQFFEGWPIEVLSKYVKDGNVETVSLTNFTTDIDYMILSPGECDEDGFAILAAYETNNTWGLRTEHVTFGIHDFYVQNKVLSFWYLQRYYMYDMPAKSISATCVDSTVGGVKKQKTQEITFPAFQDVNFLGFVKTGLGDGQLSKISLNLSARIAKATLLFNTETI